MSKEGWTADWVAEADDLRLAHVIRRAVMISMAMTGERGYTHDDYDDAMAALDELYGRAKDR